MIFLKLGIIPNLLCFRFYHCLELINSRKMIIMLKLLLVNMKEFSTDFKKIAKHDKRLFVWMIVNFLLAFVLCLVPLLNMKAGQVKVVSGYTDIGRISNDLKDGGYRRDEWWNVISFSVMALAMGIGHILLAIRIHGRLGKDIARLFLGISFAIILIAIVFLLRIVEEG